MPDLDDYCQRFDPAYLHQKEAVSKRFRFDTASFYNFLARFHTKGAFCLLSVFNGSVQSIG